MEQQHANGYNQKFFTILMNEIPETDLEGQKINQIKSVGTLELKKGQTVDEELISQVRYKHKQAFFQYLRKKSRWMELFNDVDSIIKKPVNFQREKLTRRVSVLKLEGQDNPEAVDDNKLTLKPMEAHRTMKIGLRCVAVFCLIWAALILVTETTLIWSPEYTIVY
jgi:hypothetical protein